MPDQPPVQPDDRDDQQPDVQDPTPENETDELGDAGKRALLAERDRAKKAERDAADLRAEIAKRDAEAEEAKRKAAEANGEWEKVAQDRANEIERLKADLATRDRERDFDKAVREAKLPDDLTEFVRGDTYDEMLASAQKLAERVTRPEAPDNDTGKRSANDSGQRKNDSVLANYKFG